MRLLVDCETDGFIEKLTQIHSLVLKDIDTGTVYSCTNNPGFTSIDEGLRLMVDADLVILHNGIKFDIPAIQKIHPQFDIEVDKIRDTLILSRLIWPDLFDRDTNLVRKGKLPTKLRGSHSLKAWGIRLGILKGDFGETSDWSEWTPEMQSYCEQDVEVTAALWEKIQTKEIAEKAIKLEHWFAHIISKQERFGFTFNVEKAVALYSELAQERLAMDEELRNLFAPWYGNMGVTVPKRDNRSTGYVAGAPFSKVKLIEFNPSSRHHIANRLMKLYGWEPDERTDKGQPKVDETTLSRLEYPPAKTLAKRFMLEKRIGQLAEGNQGWLKLERKGRIHGSVNTLGAVTGRCTHNHPNVAQVPGVKKGKVDGDTVILKGAAGGFGYECRELFCVPPGYKQVGSDASGLELRCLAHYMARYDGGTYTKVLLEGDIHTANQMAAGLPTRDGAKTFIYAFLYGAGDGKIGQIVGKGASAGKRLKANFLNKTPALKRLREDVMAAVKKRGSLRGIDGRTLHVRSAHSALNTLLQSAGALLVKQATINLYLDLSTRGFKWGKDWAMVAHVHDEFQLQVREELAEEIAEAAIQAFQKAGRDFDWRCPLDGESKIGTNWAECH